MNVIEFAEKRLAEEEHQNHLGLDNEDNLRYWAAYLDGARAQKRETIEKWHEACLDGRAKEAEHE